MESMGVVIAFIATLEAQRAFCVYGRRPCVQFCLFFRIMRA